MNKTLVLFLILSIVYGTLALDISSLPDGVSGSKCGLERGSAVVQTVTEPYSSFGGLCWNDVDDELLTVSPLEKTTNSYVPKYGNLERIHLEELVNETLVTLIPIKGDETRYLLITDKNLYTYTVSVEGNTLYYTVYPYQVVAEQDQAIFQAHADTNGRLWLGVHLGNADHDMLLRIDFVANTTVIVESKYSYSDFTWCKTNNGLYVVDSRQNLVRSYALSLSLETQTCISVLFGWFSVKTNIEITSYIFHAYFSADVRVEFEMDVELKGKVAGRLSSIKKDTKGRAWVGFSNSGTVMQYDLDKKKLLRTISIPVDSVTSLAFGGKDHSHLFVGTKRSSGNPPADLHSGSIFAISGTGSVGLTGNFITFPQDSK